SEDTMDLTYRLQATDNPVKSRGYYALNAYDLIETMIEAFSDTDKPTDNLESQLSQSKTEIEETVSVDLTLQFLPTVLHNRISKLLSSKYSPQTLFANTTYCQSIILNRKTRLSQC